MFFIQFKQPVRHTETETKQSGKVSASQRLSNLRDRLNTVDLIPLQLPAATNECLVSKVRFFLTFYEVLIKELRILESLFLSF